MKNQPFFIIGLPRSRTAWLANFLTWGKCFCWHEATRYIGQPSDLAEILETSCFEYSGNADSGMLVYSPDEFLRDFPGSKVLFVLRDREECIDSFCEHFQIEPKRVKPQFEFLEKKLEIWLEAVPDELCGIFPVTVTDNTDAMELIQDFLTPGWENEDYPNWLKRYGMLRQMEIDTNAEKMCAAVHPNLRKQAREFFGFPEIPVVQSVLP
jgi:hypothetical protein